MYIKLGEKKQQGIDRGFKERKDSSDIYTSISSIDEYEKIVDLLEIAAVEI